MATKEAVNPKAHPSSPADNPALRRTQEPDRVPPPKPTPEELSTSPGRIAPRPGLKVADVPPMLGRYVFYWEQSGQFLAPIPGVVVRQELVDATKFRVIVFLPEGVVSSRAPVSITDEPTHGCATLRDK
jgi:hypothetical protein